MRQAQGCDGKLPLLQLRRERCDIVITVRQQRKPEPDLCLWVLQAHLFNAGLKYLHCGGEQPQGVLLCP
ncbi:hypothetical protein CSSP291_12955 [Cronobacter sakazakii SP291]|nr:hypothetical protein CSSP291_12955 [Cronobacter sakazakii SP291]